MRNQQPRPRGAARDVPWWPSKQAGGSKESRPAALLERWVEGRLPFVTSDLAKGCARDVLAEYRRMVACLESARASFQSIWNNDKTRYTRGGQSARNRDRELPEGFPARRWATPLEIAQDAMREIDAVLGEAPRRG